MSATTIRSRIGVTRHECQVCGRWDTADHMSYSAWSRRYGCVDVDRCHRRRDRRAKAEQVAS